MRRPTWIWLRAGRIGGEEALEPAARTHVGIRRRLHRVFLTSPLIVQSGLAASLAWAAAETVVNRTQGVFAPITALVVIGSSLTQRIARTVELLVGVAVGLFIGGRLVAVTGGIGVMQVGVVVVLAMAAAVFLGGGAALIVQAGATAVLIATVIPPNNGLYVLPRLFDAAVGGAVGVAVTTLLPLHPVRIARRATSALLGELVAALHDGATAMRATDPAGVKAAWARSEAADQRLSTYNVALDVASETVHAAPTRWHNQGHIFLYLNTRPHMIRVMTNIWVLLRRTIAMVERGEPIPPELPTTMKLLADAMDQLHTELSRGHQPQATQAALREMLRQSVECLASTSTLSGEVIVAQIRSTAVDLLQATGLNRNDADQLARTAITTAPTHPAHQIVDPTAEWT